jgi:hypothetical protein
MSKLARALILAATVAALNLVGTTAIAQAHTSDDPASTRHRVLGQLELLTGDDAATSQQQVAENWNYYQQATRVPPAELQARMQADATQRKLSDRWTYYSHATQMSPAELKAWVQARDRAGTPTEKTVQVPAPVRPYQPSGQPLWLVVALGVLAAALAIVAGLALLAARRANHRAQVGPAT